MRQMLTVGNLAQKAGITPKTVRYYEEIGLLPPAARGANGYRLFLPEDANRLSFIQRAKALGLTLEEIRELVTVAEHGRCAGTRTALRTTLEQKIDDCNREIEGLVAYRNALETAAHQLEESADQQFTLHDSKHAAFSPTCTCVPDPA